MSRPRLHQGGRLASSRTVRLVPLRRTGLDHRELARILLAIMSSSHDSSGENPAIEDTEKNASSARSNDPTTSPTSEGTTATSAASAGLSAGRGATEERRS